MKELASKKHVNDDKICGWNSCWFVEKKINKKRVVSTMLLVKSNFV